MPTNRILSAVIVFLLSAVPALAEPLTFRVEVTGLQCPLCAFGVEKELLRLDDVKDVQVDIEKDVIVVTLNEDSLNAQTLKSAEAAVRAAVDKAGFPVKRLERIASAQ